MHALGVDHADRVPQDAALAGGVHALQDEQHPRGHLGSGPAGGEEPLLQVVELGHERVPDPADVGLPVAREPDGRVSGEGGEVDRTGRQPEQLAERPLLLRDGPRRPPRRAAVFVLAGTLAGVLGHVADHAARPDGRPRRVRPYACQDLGVHLLHDRRGTPAGPLGPDGLVELLRFPVPPSDAWLRTNFVATVDGSITGPDDSSGSISPASDAHHFALHRALCDAVVVAGGTARAEGYRAVDLAPWQRDVRAAEGLDPFPTLVVVTASADLDPQVAAPTQGEGGPVVVATTTTADPQRLDALRAAGVEVLQRGTEQVDLAAVLDDLAGRGLPRLLCEGGPTLHRDLLALGLVDEVLLTLAPQLVAGSGARTTRGDGLDDPTGLALSYVLLGDDDAVFTSYRTLPEKPVGRLE